jgi:hypothetical protein
MHKMGIKEDIKKVMGEDWEPVKTNKSENAEEMLARIKKYCEEHLEKGRMPMNGYDWVAGYTYVLSRILGAINAGTFYVEHTAESRWKDHVRFAKKKLRLTHDSINSLKKQIASEEKRIKQWEDEITKLETDGPEKYT